MRQSLPRVPMDRVAVLIGAKGATAKSLRLAAGCKSFNIDSDTGDVEVVWGEPGTYDPVKAMKLPDVIKAIARGMAPKAAIRLLEDDHFFELVDIRSFVGKRSNQQRRIRARIIGSQGKIRKLIENLTDTQITDAGRKEVAKLRKKLNELRWQATKITDAGLKNLVKLKRLESLWLSDTQITDAGVAELKKALPNCENDGP